MNIEDSVVRSWKEYTATADRDASPVRSIDIGVVHGAVAERSALPPFTNVTEWTLCGCLSLTSDC